MENFQFFQKSQWTEQEGMAADFVFLLDSKSAMNSQIQQTDGAHADEEDSLRMAIVDPAGHDSVHVPHRAEGQKNRGKKSA